MFKNANVFNQDIGSWNVSNVTNMSYMFYGATSFNQDIGSWNVSNVSLMSYMFQNTSNFNQDISGWNVAHISEPTNFNTNANSTWISNTDYQPNWGDQTIVTKDNFRDAVSDWIIDATSAESTYGHI